MHKDRGALLEYLIRKRNISLTELCIKLNIRRRTLYSWFHNKNLPLKIVAVVSRAINYDLNNQFKGFCDFKPPHVYLIEDTNWDVEIFKIMFNSFVETDCIEVFGNGKDAIDNLLKVSINQPSRLPDYIFLDIKMPVLDGWGFLEEYQRLNLSAFKSTKIYILSSSKLKQDIERGSNCSSVAEFISKPIELEKMRSIIEEVC